MASFVVYGDTSGQVTVAAPAVAGSNTITFPAETGTLYTTASTTLIAGQIAWDTTVKTSGFTAVAYGGYFCNTTSAAFTVTLPATPTRGQFVVIVDYAGTAATNNILVNPNGSNLNGFSANAILATNRQSITYTYIDSTQGWVASSNVYGGATPFTRQIVASYMIVAGGGGSSNNGSGGGGAGGYLSGTNILSAGSTYTFVIGGGGTTGNGNGTNGSNSTGFGLTAIGGGGSGGYYYGAHNGSSGGSGGGVDSSGTAGAGTPGQGYAGGQGVSGGSGGGGGATAVGAVGTTQNGGNGGAGATTSITGTPSSYAGGGGGGLDTYYGSGSAGTGGIGGGGAGGKGNTIAAVSGTANTGGGAGGAGNITGSVIGSGSNGGSGVIIISLPTAQYTGTVTGSPTVTTSGANTILKYTASGTYTA